MAGEVAGEVYRDDFYAFNVEAQVKILPKFIEGLNLSSLSNLINAFKVVPGLSQTIVPGFPKFLKLILVAYATNVISE